jgi:CrcB protein
MSPWLAPLLVGLGGGIGSVVRWSLSVAGPKWFGYTLAGTLAANGLGCLMAGVLISATVVIAGPGLGGTPAWKLLLVTGFCGGLTTYSTLIVETDGLLGLQRPGVALLYLMSSLAVGFVAFRLGWWVGSFFAVRA